MKKKIIFFVNNDAIFTFPLVNYLTRVFQDKYEIYLKLENTSLRKKIKILLILFLDGSMKKLFGYYQNRIKVKEILSNNVKIIKNYTESEFSFGVSINFPKKIRFNNLNIYNFHFGNFSEQRGTFIFFYKDLFNWKTIDLTFHKISKELDAGDILNKLSIDIQNMKAIDLISLPLKNMSFYVDSIKKIDTNPRIIESKIGEICREPSFFKILSSFIRRN